MNTSLNQMKISSSFFAAAEGDRGVEFFIGISICLVASLLQALGMTLQRYAHIKQQALPPETTYPVWKMWIWQIGLIIYLVSQLGGQPLALVFLSPSIVAPLGSATLAFNAMFSYFIVHEQFTKADLLGTLVAAGGAVLIAIYGYAPQGSYLLEDLFAFFGETGMIIFMCVFILYVGSAYCFGRYLEWCAIHTDKKPQWLQSQTPDRLHVFVGTIHATISGTLAASVLLLGKAGIELILTTFNSDENQFKYLGTYVILIALIAIGVLQMVFLNSALKLCEARAVVPIFFCFYTVVSMIESMVYFYQWPCFSPLSSGLIALGVMIIILGVWLLSQPKSKPVENQEDSSSIQEEAQVSETSALLGKQLGVL